MDNQTNQLKEVEKEKLAEELTAVSTDPTSRRPTNKSTRSHDDSWIPGLILILIGLLFLATNVWGFYLQNWWALFLLIPAFSNFNTAYNKYQRAGRFTPGTRSAAGWGFFFTLITVTFLFDISWSIMWPIVLILVGIGLLFNNR